MSGSLLTVVHDRAEHEHKTGCVEHVECFACRRDAEHRRHERIETAENTCRLCRAVALRKRLQGETERGGDDGKIYENKRLQMENELLRDFLQSIERM